MAVEERAEGISLVAGTGGVSAYEFIELSGATRITADSAGAEAVGIAGETVAAGETFELINRYGCKAMITLAATLSAGAAVMSDANGHAIAEATAGSLGLGWLLEGGVDNDIVTMIWMPRRRHAA